jgi:DNA-binding CsgD family transcriptional regulator
MARPDRNPKQLERIRELTLGGHSQKEIAARLRIHRNSVYRYQRAQGLRAWPVVSCEQEERILALLKQGYGTRKVGRELGVGEHQARLVAKKYHFRRKRGSLGYRYRLSPAMRKKIAEEIKHHRDFGLNLAWKYRHHVSYKTILKMAHEILRCPRFRARSKEPFLSNFPQRHYERVRANS